MASHELRTPLNSIIGFSELLASEAFGPLGAPQYREYADIIHESGRRLLRMVNQVLEIVRLKEGAADLDAAPQSIEEAVQDVADMLEAEIARRGIVLNVDGLERAPQPLADHRGLRTILANLIQNAVTFAPEGSEVRVRAKKRAGAVEIAVEDDGGGIPATDIPRLLQPFEQGENALQRATHGAGLGLSIVRLLCDAMEGELKLQSRPGKGLTAVVVLPAAAATRRSGKVA
jgi:signal transduction histidine kinase